MDEPMELAMGLGSLALFHGLLGDPVIAAFRDALASGGRPSEARVEACARFASLLYAHGENLTDYLMDRTLCDENPYSARRARGLPVGPKMEESLIRELNILWRASQVTSHGLYTALGLADGAGWSTSGADFEGTYRARMERLGELGYGLFAERTMFRIEGRDFVPIRSADGARLSELFGYERERTAIVENARALLRGRPAANALIYGDAGTGKSSTVKAVANEFMDRGLRLIEIRKDQLGLLTWAMERLSLNPLKFILFIDDLSFSHAGEEAGALKAVLEGAASTRAANTLIYATSNRRHIVAESFQDRAGDDVHAGETIQEQTSLAERFGLRVLFARPDRDGYLSIVHRMVGERDLTAPPDLDVRAERFAMEKGGRSPRSARQFMDLLQCTAQGI